MFLFTKHFWQPVPIYLMTHCQVCTHPWWVFSKCHFLSLYPFQEHDPELSASHFVSLCNVHLVVYELLGGPRGPRIKENQQNHKNQSAVLPTSLWAIIAQRPASIVVFGENWRHWCLQAQVSPPLCFRSMCRIRCGVELGPAGWGAG